LSDDEQGEKEGRRIRTILPLERSVRELSPPHPFLCSFLWAKKVV